MKAYLRHVDGHAIMAKSDSNHWIPLDTGPASGGTGAANDPFQLLVIACGGCTLIDVVDILTKSRKPPAGLELEIEVIRADTVPKVLRQLSLHYRVAGEGIAFDVVRRAVELSLTKYCSVSLSLDRAIVFEARITLNGTEHEPFVIARNPALYGD